MTITYRPIEKWPREFTKGRRRSPFKAAYHSTWRPEHVSDNLDRLAREYGYGGLIDHIRSPARKRGKL